MRASFDKLSSLGVEIQIITFDSVFLAHDYVKYTEVTWPLLRDESKELYVEYGMMIGSWWSIVGPVAIWKYLKLIFAGRKLQKSGKDYRQLGGDVLVDPDGIIRLHHVSTSPHDRPEVESIIEVVESHHSESQ